MIIPPTTGSESATGSGSGPAPDYTPPAFQYKDVDEITISAGRYYKAGHRLEGQYQDLTNMSSYWDLGSSVDVDVDAPGTMIGGDVVSSWYSVFMTGTGSFLILPFIRVDAISYSNPNTVINPADHSDGTTANDDFVSANDVFNTYRLMQLCDDSDHGTIHTIVDSVDGTPDQILISGDVTSQVAAGEWLQMIPPAGTACLYLGTIGFDASGNLLVFYRDGWRTTFKTSIVVNANLDTSFGNTEMGSCVPPVTRVWHGFVSANSEATTATQLGFYIAAGTDGTSVILQSFSDSTTKAWRAAAAPVDIPITTISIVRNYVNMYAGGFVAASAGEFRTAGFTE